MDQTLETTRVRTCWAARELLCKVCCIIQLRMVSNSSSPKHVHIRTIGALTCSEDCKFDTSSCHPLAVSDVSFYVVYHTAAS